MLEYFRQVEATGEPLVVIDHGKSVLQLVPIVQKRPADDVMSGTSLPRRVAAQASRYATRSFRSCEKRSPDATDPFANTDMHSNRTFVRTPTCARLLPLLAATMLLATLRSAAAQAVTPPRWKGTVDLIIGGEDAIEGADFGRVSGIASDAAGRIFVADTKDSQVRFFSPAGALLGRVGRAGSGPTEFKGLATIVIGEDGLLWARDEGNARLLALNVTTVPPTNIRTVPLGQITSGSTLPITFATNGDLIDEKIWFDLTANSFRTVRVRQSQTGRVVRSDTLTAPAGAFAGMHKALGPQKDRNGKVIGMAERYYFQPFGPTLLNASGPGGVRAEAVGSAYSVRVYDVNGALVRTLSRRVASVPLSRSERQRADSILKTIEVDLPFGVPNAKPPIRQLRFAKDGALWVERSTADGAPREADVYDRNGRWIAIAEWPAAYAPLANLSEISGTTALFLHYGTDDFQQVVRMRFR